MIRDNRPPRQPLFWAAVVFSMGLWMGERAWRPPSWWVLAIGAFIFASSFFLPTREWLAKTLSLGAWFLLGALLIQVRDQRLDELQSTNPQIAAFADGSSVLLPDTLFARDMRRRPIRGRFVNLLMLKRRRLLVAERLRRYGPVCDLRFVSI